ncbi:hypothetical protein T310_10274, partial [Rasamsonia emersonii CBS 393.64]
SLLCQNKEQVEEAPEHIHEDELEHEHEQRLEHEHDDVQQRDQVVPRLRAGDPEQGQLVPLVRRREEERSHVRGHVRQGVAHRAHEGESGEVQEPGHAHVLHQLRAQEDARVQAQHQEGGQVRNTFLS